MGIIFLNICVIKIVFTVICRFVYKYFSYIDQRYLEPEFLLILDVLIHTIYFLGLIIIFS